MKRYILLFIFSTIFSCRNDKGVSEIHTPSLMDTMELKYAKGFEISKYKDYLILEVSMPWPAAKQSFKYVVINKENASKTTFMQDTYEDIIITPIEKIVVTSTTHLPALELLNVSQTLVGFPGTDYVSSDPIREKIDNGNIRELGKNESLNTEVLLELNPDVVVCFGIDGGNRCLETINKSGIPVIFTGDWVENSPLAKAEWIKFFGVLYNKEKEADLYNCRSN